MSEATTAPEMGVFRAMYTTRAIREFKPDPVPNDVLVKILEAAGQAPSGGNRQPWKFIVIRSQEGKNKVADLVQQGQESRAPAPGQPRTTPTGTAAPADDFVGLLRTVPVIVIVCAIDPASTGPQTVGPFGQTYPAIENFLLAARALGLGSTITTGFRAREKEFREYLNIPDNLTPTCLLPLGYPSGKGRNRHGRKTRLPVTEIAYEEKIGQPLKV